MNKTFFSLLFLLLSFVLIAQNTATIKGQITDENGRGIILVNVAVLGKPGGTTTNEKGQFELSVQAETRLIFKCTSVGFQSFTDTIVLNKGEIKTYNIKLKISVTNLSGIEVRDKNDMAGGIIRMDPKKSELLPTVSGGIETLVKLIGLGVAAGNELSSQYSVRGGNFDENLIYVNDIEIYRPFLVRSGQQEGLSFLNSDMVSSVAFSSGGFESKYGDKMSSVLDVQYKRPTELSGSVHASLLGVNASIANRSKNTLFSYVSGLRYKTTQYILSSLDTKGEYKPAFFDWQNYFNYQLGEGRELSLLTYINSNVYRLVPETRETSYGTINEAYKIKIYFEGQEVDKYNTIMGALRYFHQVDTSLILKFIASSYFSHESESFDILGQYWIGKLEIDLGSENFGEVSENLGVGSYLNHARNDLYVRVSSIEHKGIFTHKKHTFQWGVKANYEQIFDKLKEWTYVDSSGFSLPLPIDSPGYQNPSVQPYALLQMQDVIVSENELNSYRFASFLQDAYSWMWNSTQMNLNFGIRASYWNLNNNLNISPRASLSFKPKWERAYMFRVAIGMYQQPPMYREIREYDGTLQKDVPSQKSLHFLSGFEYNFKAWERKFKFVGEAYYKYLSDLIPYVVDNVRIRYLPNLRSSGYTTGIDLKINGEFVKDAESWISLSLLQTREDIKGDYYYDYYNSDGEKIHFGYTANNVVVDSVKVTPGMIPRPTDQRVMVSMFFQDYFPNNPTYKMHLSLVFGTGLPFGPPNSEKYKQTMRTPPYKRVDIGFSKSLTTRKDGTSKSKSWLKNAWISLEVFNLLQIRNTASYLWVADVTGRVYAVPNYLTNRQLNLKLIAEF